MRQCGHSTGGDSGMQCEQISASDAAAETVIDVGQLISSAMPLTVSGEQRSNAHKTGYDDRRRMQSSGTSAPPGCGCCG